MIQKHYFTMIAAYLVHVYVPVSVTYIICCGALCMYTYTCIYIYMWWSILDDTEKLFRNDRCLFYDGQGRQELLCHLALEFRCLRHMDTDWKRDRPILGEFGNICITSWPFVTHSPWKLQVLGPRLAIAGVVEWQIKHLQVLLDWQ